MAMLGIVLVYISCSVLFALLVHKEGIESARQRKGEHFSMKIHTISCAITGLLWPFIVLAAFTFTVAVISKNFVMKVYRAITN